MVGGLTLRVWLIHMSPLDNVWPQVVAAFYDRVAADEVIADYFVDVDMFRLQRHFVDALLTIMSHGLKVSTARQLQAAHSAVRNSAGVPITGQVFDTMIEILAGVLIDFQVPAETVGQLTTVVAPLRGALVVCAG